MNDSTKLLTAFRNQLLMFEAIAKSLDLHLDLPGAPSAALAFSEILLMCLDQRGATEQMRRDRVGARTFLEAAKFLDPLMSKADISTAGRNLKESTPFFVLASAVQEYLSKMKEHKAEQWT